MARRSGRQLPSTQLGDPVRGDATTSTPARNARAIDRWTKDAQYFKFKAKRAEWKAASAFVTPSGYWHAHYNESGAPAHLIPIQDAGLHAYLRSLDIKFFHPNRRSFISLKA